MKNVYQYNNKKMKLNFKIILLFLSISSYSFCQTTTVTEIGSYLSSKNRVADKNLVKIQSLVKDLYPSVYVNNQKIVIKGDNPVCLYTDLSSLNTITNDNVSSGTIELAVVRIKSKSELNSKIDLNVFKDFTSLKCVLLIYEFNVNPSDINKMVTPANENQLVFYKIEIQS